MAPTDRPPMRPERPKPKSPAERGAEFAEHQKVLKAEAQERRDAAAPRAAASPRRSGMRRG